MKVGIFGGTFDPPHIGHLILAQEAQAQLSLDLVLWVLTPFPPHKTKQGITPIQERVSLVLLAITGNNRFKLSKVDMDRQPPQYAVDTVALLRENFPQDELIYLMGADSLNDLPTWHEPVQFVSKCDGIGIMIRRNETVIPSKMEAQIPGLSEKLQFLETPLIDISGTAIRERVEQNKPFRYFVPEKVYQYILTHKLYQDQFKD